MLPEKTKNKRKNDHQPSIILKILLFIVVFGFGIGLLVSILPYLLSPTITFSDVQTLKIQDHWMGLSPTAPMMADYELSMTDETLSGEASFSIAYDTIKQSSDITIPAETLDAFIKMLETVKLKQGVYEPFWEWTDDYPYISMLFQTDQGEIEIFTSSQGNSHTPWAANIDGVEYVIESDIPMQALALLEPYLKRDILDTMVSEYRS